VIEELSALGQPGLCDALGFIMALALPPVYKFATPAIKEKVVKEVCFGEKRICLAITEPLYGSDVANLECTATLTPDRQFYIVNGVKKWITTGM